MLDPSSSEEESDEGLEEESREVLVAPGGSQRAPPATAREGRRDAPGRSGGGGGGGAARPVSPSPSVLSEGRDEPERQLDEEQERRIRLQLYVFVVRCIAYPFNAKQPTDMARRQQKVSGGGTGSLLRPLIPTLPSPEAFSWESSGAPAAVLPRRVGHYFSQSLRGLGQVGALRSLTPAGASKSWPELAGAGSCTSPSPRHGWTHQLIPPCRSCSNRNWAD